VFFLNTLSFLSTPIFLFLEVTTVLFKEDTEVYRNGKNEKRYVIAGILSEDLSGCVREIERKLNVCAEDMEQGDCYHMELVNKIYEKLLDERLFTREELWKLLYNSEHDKTIIVYYKMGLVNQYLNKGDLYNKIIAKYGDLL
jgi:hypothetical protein